MLEEEQKQIATNMYRSFGEFIMNVADVAKFCIAVSKTLNPVSAKLQNGKEKF